MLEGAAGVVLLMVLRERDNRRLAVELDGEGKGELEPVLEAEGERRLGLEVAEVEVELARERMLVLEERVLAVERLTPRRGSQLKWLHTLSYILGGHGLLGYRIETNFANSALLSRSSLSWSALRKASSRRFCD